MWQVAGMIVSGKLRPTFCDGCPKWIECVAGMCLQGDPNKRPSASEVVNMLLGRSTADQGWYD
ncbi:TPA: hypothetical protein N0F65_007359 [Lagenidium giganteum]|uniref:Uncharacterized protein n=1 Tax=Lagenidium giganteum TaxID=4803 RepID=A0AAV2YKC1_9STRA|nr:TPA: hypothetical protein N0F65_007359 [Lagenidium giganteum]